jgi:hypothetical protein
MISENMMLLYASAFFVVGVQLYNPVLSGFREFYAMLFFAQPVLFSRNYIADGVLPVRM